MEEYTPEVQESQSDQLKRWIQDNIRVVVSIAIVIIIAGGIYSYSKRGESQLNTTISTEEIRKETASESSDKKDDTKAVASSQQQDKQVSPESIKETSTETEQSFVETANKGDSITVLARRAAANYLEKNPDSSLTKEHKIYIEDYMRKNISKKGSPSIGSSVEFSKELVAKAIEQSKKLNANQLKNLQKYSARVSSL